MLYGTGGVAFAKVNVDGATNASSTKNGYTVGGGLETAAFAAAKVRLEYRYTDLGTLDGNVHARFQSVTLGLAVPLALPGYYAAAPRAVK